MNIEIDVRGGTRTWDEDAIRALSEHALRHMGVPDTCELSISLVDLDEIHELNREYRGIDSYTDVLSFPLDDPFDEALADEDSIEIGDVVIAPDAVDEQRAQFGTSFEEEASLMLVHSILHLLGYDHQSDEERAQMEALEKEILDSYGITGVR
ncbi:MAG: rRNA maturation RNase YbeY [Coriobacteriales bacterium]